MARDRSRPPTPPLAGLIQPDGSVVVPPALAREVLRALVFALTERARSTGGQPTPAARQLLQALYDATEHSRPHPTSAVEPAVSVAEAATRMGCSPQWVRHLLAAGRLAGQRSGGVWIVHIGGPLAESQVSPNVG